MSPAPNLCVGCSSTLDGAAALPVFSEKPQPVHYYGCSHFLCGRCARANRGLLRYCMRCETVGELLGGARVGGSSILPPPVADSEGFVIGDDEDEAPPQEELPQYDPVDRKLDQAAQHIKDGQSTIHYLKPEETLSGLALRYRVDGRLLCQMNRLPTSTLSTTPHLLHTLPFLLLPPDAGRSLSSTPLHSPYEEHRRLTLRRFQVAERITSHAEASVYIATIFEARRVEHESILANRTNRGESIEGVEVRMGGELEEAIAAYQQDMAWEKTQGKGKMGSKIRTTGKLEAAVKGWGR